MSITSDTNGAGDYKTGDVIEITVTFSEAVTVTGMPRMVFQVDRMNAKGDLVEGKRRAGYVADSSTSTALVFSYTVRSVDFDKDGIRVKADGLELNGGTIKNTVGDADADLSHLEIGAQSGHKIHMHPKAMGAEVVSTPSVGGSYSTGETITIEVTFHKNVRAMTEDGTPTFMLKFGVAGNQATRHAPYARIVNGNKAQFDYVVQEGDSDPDGITAPDPAIVHNKGYFTRTEVHDSIALFVHAKLFNTYLMPQSGHAVNAE